MTPGEYLLFGSGGLCIAFFLVRTAGPFFRSRLDDAADEAARNLREDFFSFSPGHVRNVLLATGTLTASTVMLVTGDLFWAVVSGISPVLLIGVAVRHIRSRRRGKIVSQLPAFLEILAGHVKAGHSVQESLQESIPLLPQGIREEISWLCQAMRLGTPLSEALLVWEGRIPCEEVSIVVRPLRIAIPTGGNLYELLSRCRDILRAKTRQAEKLRSLTAQARLQALVLTFLPPGFILVLSRIEPGYLTRCLETPAGKAILATAGILQGLGWLAIRKIMGGNR